MGNVFFGGQKGHFSLHPKQESFAVAVGVDCRRIIASVIGARTADLLPGDGHPLMILTALILMWSATGLIRGGETQDLANLERAKENSSIAVLAIGVGVFAGGLSGLLGVGGGIVMVPLFKKWLALPMKNAIATSLICVGFFAVPGTITHTLQGGVDWRVSGRSGWLGW